MSLFGSYIQESTEVLEESYYTEFDYFTESLNTTFNEFENFHNFIEEKVDIKGAGKKAGQFIVGLAKKLVAMIQKLIAKIRGLIGKILGNKKEMDKIALEVQDVPKLAGPVGGKPVGGDGVGKQENAGNAKAKAAEMAKGITILTMSKNLELAIDNVKGPSELHLNFGYGSNGSFARKGEDKRNPSQDNGGIMHWFALIEDKSKAIESHTCAGIDKVPAEAKAIADKVAKMADRLKAIEKFQHEAESLAKKIEEIADKTYNRAMEHLSGDRTDDATQNSATNLAFSSEDMRKDIRLLGDYAAGCGKISTYISEINTHNYGAMKKFEMIKKILSGGKAAA